MAKFLPGPAVASVRGSMGGTVYSANRYGMYFRNRTKPTVATSSEAQAAKSRLATMSQLWQSLTAAQRAQWAAWAQGNPVIGSLGDQQILTGHAAFVSLNCRLSRAGDSSLSAPPVSAAPNPLVTASLNLDIGVGEFGVAYTGTPLGADDRLWLLACAVDSVGVEYVQNLLKLVAVTPKAQESPYDFQADIEGRFGTLQVGQKVVALGAVFDSATGLLSTPLRASGTVVST